MSGRAGERHDVVIVGGGLVGCATAFHLARAGASVLLVERRGINAGASGQNAGSLHFQLERRLIEQGEAQTALAAKMMQLNVASIRDWVGLEALLDADLEVVMGGGLMVAETAEQMALLERKAFYESQGGLRVELLDGPAVRARAPYLSPSVIGAAFCPDEGHAGPRDIAPAFARAAAAAGAAFMTETRVVGIARRAGGFAVLLDEDGARGARREVLADSLVIAAGAWTASVGALANLHLPLFPVALTMSVTERRAPYIGHLVQHAGRRLSLKQAHSGNVLIGGGWPARLAQAPDGRGFDLERPASVDPARLTLNLQAACEVVPSVRALNLIRTWTGMVANTADQYPLLGAVPGAPGIYVAAGGAGFSQGPTFARLISELILTGQASEPIDLYDPARFHAVNSFMGL